jgi:hypothetical protein
MSGFVGHRPQKRRGTVAVHPVAPKYPRARPNRQYETEKWTVLFTCLGLAVAVVGILIGLFGWLFPQPLEPPPAPDFSEVPAITQPIQPPVSDDLLEPPPMGDSPVGVGGGTKPTLSKAGMFQVDQPGDGNQVIREPIVSGKMRRKLGGRYQVHFTVSDYDTVFDQSERSVWVRPDGTWYTKIPFGNEWSAGKRFLLTVSLSDAAGMPIDTAEIRVHR